MNLENNISVIIPVFNAASYITKAVESALIQPEVAEVLLIEDSSKDNSLALCKVLQEKHEIVKLFTHPGNVNKGAGLSRNLGIANARFDYIAFLDADDYFLPNRFEAEREIFKKKPNTDGVYGALGFHFYSEKEKSKFPELKMGSLTTMPGKVEPRELFLSLLWLHSEVNGHFSIDTLTLKRNVFFGKTPLFNDLELCEDTAFILQLALNCVIEPGILNRAVCMRGVHGKNRTTKDSENSQSMLLVWNYMYQWSLQENQNKHLQKFCEAKLGAEKIKHAKWVSAFQLFIIQSFSNNYFLIMGSSFNSSCQIVFKKHIAGLILYFKVRIQARFFKNNSFIRNHLDYLIQKDHG